MTVTETETTPPGQASPYLFAEDIAQLATRTGARLSARTVRGYLADSKAKAERGEPLAPGDLPLPAAYVERRVRAAHHARKVTSPAWAPQAIGARWDGQAWQLDTSAAAGAGWLANRRPRGGNRRKLS